jgi:hypothetical protein
MRDEGGVRKEVRSWKLGARIILETGGARFWVSGFEFWVSGWGDEGGIHRKGGKDAMIFLIWDGILRAGRLGGERGLVPWKIRGKWGLARL